MAETITIYGGTYKVSLNGIGTAIRWLIEIGGSVGIGIILFSLILKLIVMPFDVYQRVAMRRQNLKMAENREKMEKLQKQYANDKAMYNQKLMEMYKENGISMFSSCLPMILSLIIFIVAINNFNSYSQYAAIENYNIMVNAYNEQLYEYTADPDSEQSVFSIESERDGNGEYHYYYQVRETGKYIYARAEFTNLNNLEAGLLTDETKIKAARDFLKAYDDIVYFVDADTVKSNAEWADEIAAWTEKTNADGVNYTEDYACARVLEERAQEAVERAYDKKVTEKMSFLWIKNVWATDASYKSPVLSYGDFKAAAAQEDFKVGTKERSFSTVNNITDAYRKTTYNKVTGNLGEHKNEANGYYILILLSIGTILLQQLVTMRSQKDQQQFSSVDGQGKSQQKMTMIIMTVMFAIFSFMYSAAFSIYMVFGNLFSLASTLVINKIVDAREKKKAAAALEAKYNKRFRGQTKSQDDKKKKGK